MPLQKERMRNPAVSFDRTGPGTPANVNQKQHQQAQQRQHAYWQRVTLIHEEGSPKEPGITTLAMGPDQGLYPYDEKCMYIVTD